MLYRVLPALLSCLLFVLPAWSQSGPETVPNTPTRTRDVPTGLLSEQVFQRLGRIHEMIGNEQWNEAFNALTELRNRRGLSEYEQAYILQNMGHVRMAQERYDDAIRLFRESLATNAMPNQFHFQMMLNLAQILAMQERHQESQRLIDEWIQYQTEIPLDVLQLMAVNYAAMNQYRQAINAIDRAIAASRTPRENWYQLKLAMHFELREYRESAAVLEILVRNWPERNQYWTQLAAMNMEIGNEDRALAVMALAHRKGILRTEAEWVQLFQLYALRNVPRKAAEVLAEGLERGIIEPTKRRWEDLANTWYAARELNRALDAFARASALATDGQLDLQRGHILIEQERWAEACAALRAAIDKGGLDPNRVGNSYILIGMCEFEQGNLQAARVAFQQARGFDRHRNAAEQWLKHMDEEAQRERERRAREAEIAEQAAAG